MRGTLPILMIVVAGILFYWYVDPTYAALRTLRDQEATVNLALDRALELQETRDALVSRYNTFSQTDLARLEKLLPDHVDNVRLVLDMDALAAEYGMRVRNVAIEEPVFSESESRSIGPDEKRFESVVLTFTVTGRYETFRQFLRDLERSLRLVDIVGLTFASTDSGLYDITISLQTYWLKP